MHNTLGVYRSNDSEFVSCFFELTKRNICFWNKVVSDARARISTVFLTRPRGYFRLVRSKRKNYFSKFSDIIITFAVCPFGLPRKRTRVRIFRKVYSVDSQHLSCGFVHVTTRFYYDLCTRTPCGARVRTRRVFYWRMWVKKKKKITYTFLSSCNGRKVH